ncbi:transcription factor IBH1-like 1 [Momordica charantia]|uniref:Transcription factor IBH1-like 1 n=1 Tax=Momordica charantia TaxID=3673 RepID=A0A6J1C0T4_MOMCH|nr:transcription factor IBH1-like 1 [Momordica charantia]
MCNPSTLRREFLKKWMMGLQILSNNGCGSMTVSERKKAIKLSADIALASSRDCATRWSRAVIAGAVGRSVYCQKAKNKLQSGSKKILKRSRRVWRRKTSCSRKPAAAESVARRLVEKRTKILRGLVPGGEFMDEISLIEETLDYISALQAQVDVMRCLATAYKPSIHDHE